VALESIPQGTTIELGFHSIVLPQDVPAKHKFTVRPMAVGDSIYMYGLLVGKIDTALPAGALITRTNTIHATGTAAVRDRSFRWIMVPLVYCENRNIDVLKEALTGPLGYDKTKSYKNKTETLLDLIRLGLGPAEIRKADLTSPGARHPRECVFKNIDGIKFLPHHMGCCSPRFDAATLCGLIAGAKISKLCVGLECGGSDGFSGISVNPAVGYAADLLVAWGGSVILSEFPELCGVEQDLADRCVSKETAEKFLRLMKVYHARAGRAGLSGALYPTGPQPALHPWRRH
jgi:hypothetical protein